MSKEPVVQQEIVTAFPNTKEVRYDNELNRIPIGFMNESEQNIFFAILSQVKETSERKTKLSFTQIRELASFQKTSNKELIKSLDNMTTKLASLNVRIHNQQQIIKFTLFPTFQIDGDQQTLTVAVNEDFRYIVNDLAKGFVTNFDIEEFTSIKSKYAKTAFRLAREHENEVFDVVLKDFKELFSIPKSYRPTDINRLILTKVSKILQDYFTVFEITPVQDEKGKAHRIIAYRFNIGKRILRNLDEPRQISLLDD